MELPTPIFDLVNDFWRTPMQKGSNNERMRRFYWVRGSTFILPKQNNEWLWASSTLWTLERLFHFRQQTYANGSQGCTTTWGRTGRVIILRSYDSGDLWQFICLRSRSIKWRSQNSRGQLCSICDVLIASTNGSVGPHNCPSPSMMAIFGLSSLAALIHY